LVEGAGPPVSSPIKRSADPDGKSSTDRPRRPGNDHFRSTFRGRPWEARHAGQRPPETHHRNPDAPKLPLVV